MDSSDDELFEEEPLELFEQDGPELFDQEGPDLFGVAPDVEEPPAEAAVEVGPHRRSQD